MDLWLARHGEAVPASLDLSRPLSAEGIRAVSAVAATIAEAMGRPHLVAASRKRRARQTAEILGAAAGYPDDRIEETNALSPEASPDEFLSFLDANGGGDCILCVGHLPSIARIASCFLSAREPIRLVFNPGSICRIRLASIAPGKGDLLLFR